MQARLPELVQARLPELVPEPVQARLPESARERGRQALLRAVLRPLRHVADQN